MIPLLSDIAGVLLIYLFTSYPSNYQSHVHHHDHHHHRNARELGA